MRLITKNYFLFVVIKNIKYSILKKYFLIIFYYFMKVVLNNYINIKND